MRVLVPIKRVIDYQVKIRVLQNNKGVDQSGVKMSMNPFCEIAVEQAVKMKESKIVEQISAITIGPKESESILRTALAMGADQAIHIETSESIDQVIQPIHVAKILKKMMDDNKYDFCILGKQSIDDDYNQTGQMLSQLMNWPMSTFLASLDFKDGQFQIEKEIDGGIQQLQVPKNSILTCDLRLNVPRYPKLPMMMKAKKKPIEKKDLKEFDLGNVKSAQILKVTEPPKRQGGIMVESVDELLDKLRNEAKVLQIQYLYLIYQSFFLLFFVNSSLSYVFVFIQIIKTKISFIKWFKFNITFQNNIYVLFNLQQIFIITLTILFKY